MNIHFERISQTAILASVLLNVTSLQAAELSNGDFESAPFLTGWSVAGTVTPFGGLAPNSTRSARLASSGTARVGQNVTWGSEWYLDFYFAISNSTNRSFSLTINVGADAANSGSATVNLRCQSGVFNAYSAGSWGNDLGLGTVLPSHDANGDGDFDDAVDTRNVYRMRLTGHDWGQTAARYDLALSAANATNFAATVRNLARWHNGSGVNGPPTAFLFNTIFGSNPGFWVDDVTSGVSAPPPVTNAIINISGTYPHLTVFSPEGEIGIGAVVPWADRLWFVTYPPHHPGAGGDKLWTVDSNLFLTARPESVGGTHANRMIHRESQQLIIGPYFIDTNANVRVVPRAAMPGRLTGNARHLTDPANQIYFASMEEGFYAVDVNTLAVTTLKPDAQTQGSGAGVLLSGNHGKGLYSGQGRIVYANNGEGGWSVGGDFISGFNSPAGLLAEISGHNFTNDWRTLERRNFTEVTGPGGIYGNTRDTDPLWALGWDKRSVLLKLRDGGVWRTFRLPKGSYTHDSFQGWYTEWPRIREITEGRMLMHMHGLFYNFPKTFSAANTGGLSPICTYLKMPVDYCWWNGQLVIARDDASTTGGNIWAGQSHSAPWFGQLSDLETWGPPAGFGGPWKDDAVTANTPSEPFLARGFAQRVLHLKHGSASPVNFTLQHDATGAGAWANVTNLNVPANGYTWLLLPPTLDTTWVRLVPDQSAANVTAYFQLANAPQSPTPGLFAAIADASATNAVSEGILRPRSGDARTLQFAATLLDSTSASPAYYEIDGSLQLRRTTNAAAEAALRTTYSLSNAGFSVDAASVLYVSGANRFRLPKSSAAYDAAFASGWPRGAREVVTERQMFQAHGTFYELPLSGSGGFRRIRPVTTHGKRISDFASWRGLFAIAGIVASAGTNTHVYRSDDGRAALWFGNVDDLWRMGAPRGVGGPWKDTAVAAGTPSDPYLMLGYERKELALSHAGAQPVTFTVEVDFAADNTWSEYGRFTVAPGEVATHVFPAGYNAHWVRLKSDATTRATATFTYTPALKAIYGKGLEAKE